MLDEATTTKTLWMLNSDEYTHLTFEPKQGMNAKDMGYLVLPVGTKLRIESNKRGNAVCILGAHTILIDPMWLAFDVDLEEESDDWPSNVEIMRNTSDIILDVNNPAFKK